MGGRCDEPFRRIILDRYDEPFRRITLDHGPIRALAGRLAGRDPDRAT